MTQTFDPFDPGQAQEAWALLEQLRAAGPVASISGGMHYITRHAECRALLRDTATFSNASGFKAPGVEIPSEDRLLGELDPPRHTAVRRVMVTALTPKVIHAAEPFVRETAQELLRNLTAPSETSAATTAADLVPAFTVPLPNRVTLHMLGIDPADADQIARWAKGLMESTFPLQNRTERGEGFAGAFPEFAGYIDSHIERRAGALARGETHDDVLARLLRLEVDGELLPRRQVRALVRNLITGGLTTTSQLLGNLLFQVLTVPGLEDAVRADRTQLVPAIEESLRVAPPVLFVPRGCRRDADVGGCPVQAGERVIVGTASANRDERVFSHADEFRLDREHLDQHLTFGYGPHVCPGASVARIVARIALETFLDTFAAGSVRLEPGYTFENVPTYFEIGPRRLPVHITGELP